MLCLSKPYVFLFSAMAALFVNAGGANAQTSISAISRTPPAPGTTETVTVTAKVSNSANLEEVSVVYTSSADTTSETLRAVDDGNHGDGDAGDSVFAAQIPPQPKDTKVTFAWRVRDKIGNTIESATRTYICGRTPGPEFRAIWADSWNESFRTTSETDTLLKTCRAANINAIIAEVRKVGDAYYKSNIEPRASNIPADTDFDPLGYLIDQAHKGKQRIQVHGWFVMHRIGGPFSPEHILARHPEYEMVKLDGTHGESGKTRFLDPGHPGVVEHNVAVILDCLSNYDLDGYHFDYIRYPEEQGDWGYNPASVARFNAVHGKAGFPDPKDKTWQDWRRECVNLEVRKIYVKAWQKKPQAILSVSTVNWGSDYDNFENSRAYAQAFQDWGTWLDKGTLDYNALMNYVSVSDNARFLGWTNASVSRNKLRGSIIGTGAYLSSSVQGAMDQLKYVRSSGADGMCIYDWGSEVDANKKGETREQFYTALKEQLFNSWVEPPVASWKKNPTTGIVEGTVTSGGLPVDHAVVTVDGMPQASTVTDGMGWFGLLHLPKGSHTIKVSGKGVGEKITEVVSKPGKVATVTLSLDSKTTEANGAM